MMKKYNNEKQKGEKMDNIFNGFNFMEGASEQEFFDAAVENVSKIKQLEDEGIERNAIIVMLGLAIEIGVMDDGEISEQEDRMIKYVLEKTYPDRLDDVMNQINASISVDFSLIKLSQLNQIASPSLMLPLLNTILCFAYVDGEFNETTSRRLSSAVGAVVM